MKFLKNHLRVDPIPLDLNLDLIAFSSSCLQKSIEMKREVNFWSLNFQTEDEVQARFQEKSSEILWQWGFESV
jgi:hypothetical protein